MPMRGGFDSRQLTAMDGGNADFAGAKNLPWRSVLRTASFAGAQNGSPAVLCYPRHLWRSPRLCKSTSSDLRSMKNKGYGALTPSVPFLFKLVEPGGFEPPSVSPLPLALHV